MVDFQSIILDRILEGRERPKVFIETGTQRGLTTVMAHAYGFELVITCDCSTWFQKEREERFAGLPIFSLLGDSRTVLETFSRPEPTLYYLDAHWDRTAGGKASHPGAPLWDELAVIQQRPYPDIVVVDDVRVFGTGPDVTGTTLWERVSCDAIAAALEPIAASRIIGDQFVVYREDRRSGRIT